MILTTEQTERLEQAAKPLMDCLSSPEYHPHIQVIVTSTDAEIFESLARVKKEKDKLDDLFQLGKKLAWEECNKLPEGYDPYFFDDFINHSNKILKNMKKSLKKVRKLNERF